MMKNPLAIPDEIGCLDGSNLRATLISTAGAYCDVWQVSRVVKRNGVRRRLNYVIKRHRMACSAREARVYQRNYQELRDALGKIVPPAIFIRTRVNGVDNVVAMAYAVTPWFNIANPLFQEDALPLLARWTKAREELQRFVAAARRWYDAPDRRLIDLWGVDNLLLDNKQAVRYVDSFNVFFYPDMAYAISDMDESFMERVNLSLRRLEYLEFLLRETAGG